MAELCAGVTAAAEYTRAVWAGVLKDTLDGMSSFSTLPSFPDCYLHTPLSDVKEGELNNLEIHAAAGHDGAHQSVVNGEALGGGAGQGKKERTLPNLIVCAFLQWKSETVLLYIYSNTIK